MTDNAEILNAVKDLDKKIGKNHAEIKNTLFGPDGTGGMLRTLVDLESTVCGVKGASDDRGIVGDVKDIKEALNGEHGIKSTMSGIKIELEVVKTKQRIWNLSLSGGQIAAWLGILKKTIF